MSPRRTAGATRPIELLRGGWGVCMLVAPRRMMSLLGVEVDVRSLVVARVLGARQVAQAALSGSRPSPEVLALGVWVDVVHCASLVGFAAVDRDRARASLLDAGVAGTWAGLGYRDLVRDRATPPSHEGWRDAVSRTLLGFLPGGAPLGRRAEAARRRTSRSPSS